MINNRQKTKINNKHGLRETVATSGTLADLVKTECALFGVLNSVFFAGLTPTLLGFREFIVRTHRTIRSFISGNSFLNSSTTRFALKDES